MTPEFNVQVPATQSDSPFSPVSSSSFPTLNPTVFVQNMHLNSPMIREPRHIFRRPNPKVKRDRDSSHPHHRPLKPARHQHTQVTLARLSDWLRYTASGMHLRKDIYNKAVALLNSTLTEPTATYPLAAAALTLIVKFEHQQTLRGVRELPMEPTPMHPEVPLRNITHQ